MKNSSVIQTRRHFRWDKNGLYRTAGVLGDDTMLETVFQSEHISFVKVSEELIHDYLEMVNDIEGVAKYIGEKRTPYSYDEELNFIRGKIEACAPMFSMIETSSGEFIGNIEFMDINDECAELGIAITAKKQEMGYGTEAIQRMLGFGFQNLGLQKIVLKAFLYNERAIHVYEKCGFVKYGMSEKEIFMEIMV